jgi:putative ABC transport system permease protein
VNVLDFKLWRDIRGHAGLLFTVIATIAIGAGSFIGLLSAQRIDLKKVPLTALPRLARTPGIAAVESRVTFDVLLDMPNMVEPVTGRLISMPAQGFDRVINGVHLVRGSGFSDKRNEEVIVSESFAQAHHLEPGDRLEMILNRRLQSFVIVGMAISPEFIYTVQRFSGFAPDPMHFGILYVKDSHAREILGFKDAANQIVGQIVPGYEQDVDFLLEQVDQQLAPYGVFATTPRRLQASHRFISDEIRNLGNSATIMPSIFLLVAVLVLNVLMSRFAQGQRTIIGTLKAIGYSSRLIVEHYLSFGLVVGLAGGALGLLVGLGLAHFQMLLYKDLFHFPTLLFQGYPDLMLGGLGISIGFALLGTAKGVSEVLHLHAAEAMRPKPPDRGGAIVLERVQFLWKRLSFRTHIALRGMFRNHGRSLTAVVCAMLATAIMFTALSLYDSLSYLVDYQFERVNHSDIDLTLRDARNLGALYDVRNLPGVQRAEPVFAMAADLRLGRASRRVSITGLDREHQLTTPLDERDQPIAIPPTGLLLSEKLAELLAAKVGDRVELIPVLGQRLPREVPVAAIAREYMGANAYADIGYLSRLVNEPVITNHIQLTVETSRLNDLYAAVKHLPDVSGVTVRQQIKANIVGTLLRTMMITLAMVVLFAGLIAFGSILNASLIEIADRTRDISTFRVLGYRPLQVAGIFFRVNAVVFAAGLVLGVPVGYWMVLMIARVYNTEMFRMPVMLSGRVALLAMGLALGFTGIAQWFVYSQIRRLDWLEGIKVKE